MIVSNLHTVESDICLLQVSEIRFALRNVPMTLTSFTQVNQEVQPRNQSQRAVGDGTPFTATCSVDK